MCRSQENKKVDKDLPIDPIPKAVRISVYGISVIWDVKNLSFGSINSHNKATIKPKHPM